MKGEINNDIPFIHDSIKSAGNFYPCGAVAAQIPHVLSQVRAVLPFEAGCNLQGRMLIDHVPDASAHAPCRACNDDLCHAFLLLC